MKSQARIQYEQAYRAIRKFNKRQNREFYYSVALYRSIRDSGSFDRNIFFNAKRSLAVRI